MPLRFEVDEVLVNAMFDAAEKGFKLGGRRLVPVGVGRMPPMAFQPVSGIIGIAGRVNGSILVNMSEVLALQVTSGMLMTEFRAITNEVLDGIGEVTNVIGGRMKSSLATSGYPLDNITLPSVIIGQNYSVTHARGMLVYSVAMMAEDESIVRLHDRLVQVVLTLMTSNLKRTEG